MRIPKLNLAILQDYSALITISHPDQLTDTLINEKLGLDYHVQRVPSNRPSPAQETATQGDHAGSERIVSSIVKDELPPVPPAMMLGRPVHQPVSTSDNTSASNRQPSSSVPETAARYPTEVLSTYQPQSRQVSGAGGPQLASAQQPRQTSGTGGDHPQDSHADRHRKVSLTTRLGRAFGNPAMQERASENSSEASASSPSGSSKIKSSFSKAFKRTSGGNSPLTSPRTDTHDGPPVPPKDDYPVRPVLGNQESGDSGRFRTVSGGLGYKPPAPQAEPTAPSAPAQIYDHQPAQNGQSSRAAAFPEPVKSRLYTPTSNQSHISPSPSAKRVMAEARIKSITQEEEIQNRFRRELHLDDRGGGAREVVVTQDDSDDDDDVRLPYDTSDHSVTDHLKGDDPADQRSADVAGAAEPQSRSIADDRPSDNDAHQPEPTSSSVQDSAGGHLTSDLQQRTEQISAVEQAAEARRIQDAAEHEAHRLQEEADREAEAAARRLQQEAEEFAEREEARRIQEQEEQAVRAAEARRIQEEEEESRRKLEEEEKLRIALEEQKRIEEQRLREEEERARQEEVRRVEEGKQAAERARKDSIKQSLLEGKQKGGIMLRGVSLSFPVLETKSDDSACYGTDDEEPNMASASIPATARGAEAVQERQRKPSRSSTWMSTS